MHDLRLRGVINIPVDAQTKVGIMVLVFTAAAATRGTRQSAEGALEWVSQDRLAALDLVEDLPTLLPRVLAMGPNAPPFFAHYRYDEQGQLIMDFGGLEK